MALRIVYLFPKIIIGDFKKTMETPVFSRVL